MADFLSSFSHDIEVPISVYSTSSLATGQLRDTHKYLFCSLRTSLSYGNFVGSLLVTGPKSHIKSHIVLTLNYDKFSWSKLTLQVYLSLHSYSQLILLPYGFDRVLPKDFESLKTLGDEAAEAMLQSGGAFYAVGNTVEILYEASGI